MNAYLRHQAALERKRASKKRVREAREQSFDFATVCTGVQGSGNASDEGVSREGGVEDLASSVASASQIDVERIVTERVAALASSLRADMAKDLENKFDLFGGNVVEAINNKFSELVSKQNVSNPSVPAPQYVPVRPSSDKGRLDPSPLSLQTAPQARR